MRIKKDKPNIIPRAGKISIGEQYETGRGTTSVRSIDYFRATGKYSSIFHDVVGKQPRELLVGFPSDDIALVCPQRYQIRNAQGKVFSEGDGQTFWYVDPKDSQKKWITLDPDKVEAFQQRAVELCSSPKITAQWKEVLSLRLVLPYIPVIGTWDLQTAGAESSIKNIISVFDLTKEMAGTVVRIPFKLSVEMHVSDTAIKRKYPVLSLHPLLSGDSLEKVALNAGNLSGKPLKFLQEQNLKMLE